MEKLDTKKINAAYYDSPLGRIFITVRDGFVTGLYFEKQKYFHEENVIKQNINSGLYGKVKNWLDIYFSGEEPNFIPPLNLDGTTPFRKKVWDVLLKIPYGKTMTYGEIARLIGAESGKNVSAQAVGGAVGHNPISIIVPCHRVIGANGNLTGYAGGIDIKIALLKRENSYSEKFYIPVKRLHTI